MSTWVYTHELIGSKVWLIHTYFSVRSYFIANQTVYWLREADGQRLKIAECFFIKQLLTWIYFQASTIDGRRKGACLFCQEYFMDLYLLAELKTISLKVWRESETLIAYLMTVPFKVTTVDMQKPPPDFRTNFEATHPPILIDGGLAILENDKIERHIMKSVPGGHNLFVQGKQSQTHLQWNFLTVLCFRYQIKKLPRSLRTCIRNWSWSW